MQVTRISFTIWLCSVLLAATAAAQKEFQLETVVENLVQPIGVAIQPETGHVFVADAGSGKISRVADGKTEDVVINFTTGGPATELPFLKPLRAMTFFNKDMLIVGVAAEKAKDNGLSMFIISDSKNLPLKTNNRAMATPDSDRSMTACRVSSVAVSAVGVLVSCNNGESQDLILKLPTDKVAPEPGSLAQFISSVDAADRLNPLAIASSPDGFLTVAQAGSFSKETDSLLTFYDLATGELRAKFETGLRDIIAISYGPWSGRLYALDFSADEPSRGGLYKLVSRENNTKCVAIKIMDIPQATSMAFGDTGDLFVTTLGVSESSDKPTGKLQVIRQLDAPPATSKGDQP